jgi:hypothetical protein
MDTQTYLFDLANQTVQNLPKTLEPCELQHRQLIYLLTIFCMILLLNHCTNDKTPVHVVCECHAEESGEYSTDGDDDEDNSSSETESFDFEELMKDGQIDGEDNEFNLD